MPIFLDIYSPVRPLNSPLPQQTASTSSFLGSPLPSASASPASEIMYSGKHNGLYLYFSRIIRFDFLQEFAIYFYFNVILHLPISFQTNLAAETGFRNHNYCRRD